MLGETFSHYRLLEKLGGGGMGVVYKAEDLHLGRLVAVKLLPSDVWKDPLAVERFKREARAASSLNHPNICTIHDFGETSGEVRQPFIVLELLDGNTLKHAIARQGMPLGRLLHLGLQIVDALEAAHGAGIVHRDIKPANIFVTRKDQVKLLDFGLARQMSSPQSLDTTVEPLTTPGMPVGTVAYMSPEQVRGQQLDARTDLFSFGLVLYEMATGQQAYSDPTAGLLFEAILTRAPAPLASVNPELPKAFDHIVAKLLEKDRELRYQSAAEVKADLKRLNRDASAILAPAVTPATPTTLALKYVAVIAALLVLAAALIVWNRPTSSSSAAPTVRQISRWNKSIVDAHLSPDRGLVAFGSTIHGVTQVFVMLSSGGDPLQLTHDEGAKAVDGFSADGKEIYYTVLSGRDEEWAVPVLGGTPRRLVTGHSLTATPDGQTYFYLKSDSTAIFKAAAGMEEQQVYSFSQPAMYPQSLLLFPGSTSLLVDLVAQSLPPSEETQLVRIDLTDQTTHDFGTISGSPTGFAWLDPGKTLIFSRTVNSVTNLWMYDLVSRALRQVTAGPGADLSPMPDAAGEAIYYVNSKRSGVLTSYATAAARNTEIVSDDVSQPTVSPDGRRVMYLRFLEAGAGSSEIWVSDVDGRNRMRLASGRGLVTGYWSADGSHVSYMENTEQQNRVFLVRADGRQLRELRGVEGFPTFIIWSADGASVYLSSRVGEHATVWKASADGTRPERLLENGCEMADASRDGQYLLCFLPFGRDMGIHQVSLEGNRRELLLPGVETFGARFAPDGKSFVYAVSLRDQIVFRRQGWRDGKLQGTSAVAVALPFVFPFVYKGNAFDFSPDLSTIVYARPSGQADLYVMPIPR